MASARKAKTKEDGTPVNERPPPRKAAEKQVNVMEGEPEDIGVIDINVHVLQHIPQTG